MALQKWLEDDFPPEISVQETAWPQNFDLQITGRIDRIDITADGHFNLYDYKTGTLKSPEKDIQLWLYAVLMIYGDNTWLKDISQQTPNYETLSAHYISLKAHKFEVKKYEVTPDKTAEKRQKLINALRTTIVEGVYESPPKPNAESIAVNSYHAVYYNHLARYDEWRWSESEHQQKAVNGKT